MNRALLLAAASAVGLATPAFAQHAGHGAPPAAKAAAPAQATGDPSCPPEHAAMGHCTPETAPVSSPAPMPTPPSVADPHAGHQASAPSPGTPAGSGPALPPPASDPSCPPEHAAMGHCAPKAGVVGAAPPVAPPSQAAFSGPEHAADAVWDPQLMAAKRQEKLISEHGGFTGYMVLFDRLEYRAVDGRDGYAWDAEGWYGGDYSRLWIKTEGEGEFGAAVESAEVQALYSRAIDPWFNLQAGVRYDVRPRPNRAHLVLGVQGLAPYWFEIDAAAFLSDKGELTARVEAEYDQRLTNRLILEPRVEFDLAAQDVPELGIGAGLSSVDMGLRLRYEIKREFAPYVGVQYERRLGDTADLARAAGEDVGGWAFLVGLRSWF